jgi:phospholipase C
MPKQEKGMRRSCPLPYELHVNGSLSPDQTQFVIRFEARTDCFGERAAGCPFTVYAMTGGDAVQIRNYAVAAGNHLEDSWNLRDFGDGRYRLRVYGPNGFFREFAGRSDDPPLDVLFEYRASALNNRSLSGDVEIRILNHDERRAFAVQIRDRSYKTPDVKRVVGSGETALVVVDTQPAFQWYDLGISISGSAGFDRRFAGRVETGKWTFTDPAIGWTNACERPNESASLRR